MSGYLHSTPWGRNGIAAYIEGGQAALSRRVPPGHTLSVSAQSARGPWRVVLTHDGAEVFHATTTGPDLSAVIEKALVTTWP